MCDDLCRLDKKYFIGLVLMVGNCRTWVFRYTIFGYEKPIRHHILCYTGAFFVMAYTSRSVGLDIMFESFIRL